jgi:hypothetical protein
MLFSNTSVFAYEKESKQLQLTLEESQQLLEDVQYLLSDKETIDYDDLKLNKMLNKHQHKYDLFKIYKAFIEFDKSAKIKEDTDKAKNILLDHFNKINQYCYWSEDSSDEANIMNHFLSLISGGELTDDLAHLLPGEREKNYNNGYKYIKIPLWLMLKHPQIISIDGVYTLTVNAKNSIKNLKEFDDFMSHFAKIHLGYLTPFAGHQKINAYLNTKHFIDIISFDPKQYINTQIGICAKQSFNERMLYSEKVSYLSIKHRLKYEKFLESLHRFSSALSRYYQTNYDLSNYSNQTDNIISYYVCDHTEQNYDEYDPTVVNFMALSGIHKINDLRSLIKTLGVEYKSEFLHHAVVANLDFNFIHWLIQNGADVNYKFRNETALMASFRNIEVMKLLIKSGVNIAAENKAKETALFYAIKFNNLEAVTFLIDIGANINATTVPKAISSDKRPFSKTPLIYAKRYASKEVVDLLIKHGAKDGSADPDVAKEWIALGHSDL